MIAHPLFVRTTHWINAICVLALLGSGIGILLAHPEFYWGDTGYFGKEPAFSLGIEQNVLYSKTGRNLHYLFAWIVVVNAVVYVVRGLVTQHFRRKLVPEKQMLTRSSLWREFVNHIRFRPSVNLTSYNALQRFAYIVVVFVVAPVLLLTGLAMSPAITTAFPFVDSMWGGRQSARTFHFLATVGVLGFTFVHIVQILISGPRAMIKAMVSGNNDSPSADATENAAGTAEG